MLKKIVSVFVVAALLIFSISCYSTRVQKGLSLRSLDGKNYKIFWVVTKSGRIIQFQGEGGAQIMGNVVMGQVYVDGRLKVVRIPISEIEKVKMRAPDTVNTILFVGGITFLTAALGFYILLGISMGGD